MPIGVDRIDNETPLFSAARALHQYKTEGTKSSVGMSGVYSPAFPYQNTTPFILLQFTSKTLRISWTV